MTRSALIPVRFFVSSVSRPGASGLASAAAVLTLVVAAVVPSAPVSATPQVSDDPTGRDSDRSARISGFVRDSTSGEALIGANVYLRETQRGAATNSSGFYAIGGVSPGTYALTASYIGYRPDTRTVEIGPREEVRLDIALIPEDVEIDEVVVSAEDAGTDPERIGSASLETARITEIPAVIEPDVFRTLQLLPGVKAASDYSSGLYVRGGSPDQTLILLDGTTVYNPTHFFGLFSTFNPDAIKDVQLYKGTYPVEYGGRLGSVVDIRNKDGNRREFAGTASLGLLASRAMVEGPIESGSWMLAVRRSTLEPVLALLDRADVEGVPKGFHFYDLNGKINWDLHRANKLSLAGYAGSDVLDFPFNDQLQLDVEYGNRTLTGTWTHVASDAVFTRLQGTVSRYYSRPRFALGGTDFSRENGVWDATIDGRLEWAVDDRHQLQAGLHGGRFSFRLRESFDGNRRLDEHLTSPYGSMFVQDTYRPNPLWEIRAGLRGSYFGRGSYLRLAPRVSVQYEFRPGWRLQAGYGRYHQFKSMVGSGPISGLELWLTSGEEVPPAFGDQVGVGLEFQPSEGLQIELESFYRTMRALFELDPRIADVAGTTYHELFHFGEGYAYGAEVLVRRRVGDLTGHLGYTFGVTRRSFPDLNDGRHYPPKYDRTHQLQAVLAYRFTEQWSLSLVGSAATGQAYTQPDARYRTVDDPFQAEPRTVLIAGFNGARLPPYHRIDLGLARSGTWFGVLDYRVSAQVVNVYARRNVWFYQFDRGPDGEIDRTEVPQIPVALPNLSLTVEW